MLYICLIDYSGRRSERRQWIRHTDDTDGIIWVCGLDHFAKQLSADLRVNAMEDALIAFEEHVNARIFADCPVILILNRLDLFVEMIQIKSLSECFGDEWDGPDYYNPAAAAPESDVSLSECVNQAIEFIRKQFESRLKPAERELRCHVLTAIDVDEYIGGSDQSLSEKQTEMICEMFGYIPKEILSTIEEFLYRGVVFKRILDDIENVTSGLVSRSAV